jgi:hypothetical protein
MGYSPRHIGRELSRSDKAIKRILAMPAVAAEVVAQKRELSDLYEDLNRKVLESVTDENIKDASLLQKATTAGIFTDKMRLLRDQSTANINVADLLDVAELIRRERDEANSTALPQPERC